jgi:hypothetical protein
LQKYWFISVRKPVQSLEMYPILNLFEQRAQKPLFFTQLEGEVNEEPDREQHPDRRRIAKRVGYQPTLGGDQA